MIHTREELVEKRKQWKRDGKTVGFTSGTFDILHAGHIDYLQKSKEKCDILIVGMNSDSSVKEYKSKDRPINPQEQRVHVLSSLSMIDYIFIFDEKNNRQNIEALKPDVYIKAGDYTVDQLGSKQIVESYGGKVEIIPLVHDTSTSKIIEKILNNAHSLSQTLNIKPPEKKPALFIDRDGTINTDIEYLHEPEKFELIPDAAEGIKKFQDAGYRIVVITTQAGIGLGYFTKEDFYKVNKEMFKQLGKYGIIIDRIYYCPCSLSDDCACRKPKTGLVDRAVADLNIDVSGSVFVGDKSSDIACGKAAGVKTIAVTTGQDKEFDPKPDYVVGSVKEAAEKIMN